MTQLKMKMKNNSKILMNLPTPYSISYAWNFGSMLGLILMNQIVSGLLLTMNYSPSFMLAFSSVSNIMHNLWFGWLIRFMHATGASMMMLFIYMHICRNIYFSNFKNFLTSITGMTIFLMTMMTAFLGYVLPWGQMSFWGATVITSLASVVPLIGKSLVYWIWGNFAVSNSTLNRFFMLHFIIPLILFLLMVIHLETLHMNGSMNKISMKNNIEMMEFHPKFTLKDLVFIMSMVLLLITINLIFPYSLMDPENFIIANPMSTPLHIQPEWYFLYSYAILRCIPNKMGGVIALVLSILTPLMIIFKKPSYMNNSFFLVKKLSFWIMVNSVIMLTYVGMNAVSEYLNWTAQMFCLVYFSMFFFL